MTPGAKRKQEDEFELGLYLQELWQKKHYFFISGAIFVVIGALYIIFKLPVFQTTASVVVNSNTSSSKNLEDFISGDLFGSSTTVSTETGVLKSYSVVMGAVQELGLRVQYADVTSMPAKPIYPKYPFIAEFKTINKFMAEAPFTVEFTDSTHFTVEVEYNGDNLPDFEFSTKSAFDQPIHHKFFDLVIHRNDSLHKQPFAGKKFEVKYRSLTKYYADILSNLNVEATDKDANLINLTYQDVIPQRALDLLNNICEAYIQLGVKDKAEVASLTLDFLNLQTETVGQQLSRNERELQDFKEKNKSVDLSEESQLMLHKMNDAEVEREKSKISLASLEALRKYVEKNIDITSLAPASMGLPDPLLNDLIASLQALQTKRKSLAYGVKNDAPALKMIDAQIAETRLSLMENIRAIETQLQITSNSINSQLGEYESMVQRVPEKERELLAIKRNFEVNQNIYTYLLQKKAETGIAKASAISDNKILDHAYLADAPVAPSKPIVAIVILILSGFFPAGIILAQMLLRSTVRTKDDIASITDIPVVGVVGHSAESSNLAVHLRPKSVMAESFRTIRTNLMYYGLNNGNRVIMITSSIGGEGKSFVTLNMATILAMQGHKVIVLGLDLRKPKLFQDFNIRNETGMSLLLAGSATVDQVIRKTTVEHMDLIPAGPIPPNPAELLSKQEMKDLLTELRKRYDYIIIDTPPVGIVADSFLIAPLADITLYIVRQGYSKLEFLRSLDEIASENRFKNLGLILNDSAFSKTGGYGYGHQYGHVKGSAGYYEEDEVTGWRKWFRRG